MGAIDRLWRKEYRELLATDLLSRATAYSCWASNFGKSAPDAKFLAPAPLFGGIVGIAEIVDCVRHIPVAGLKARLGYVLMKRRPVPFVKWPGAQGWRDAPKELLKRIDDDEVRDLLAS